ncbi:sulfotransferase family 2 domain-containing protein [Leptolyngbya sp. O-77]|uniref:sulfotransferase family 2 domain-containing protein n=1 Tax=Leptolyngbya sp. O-77 TaxID=1080068 RepID=UPI00074D4BAA|nr:sulfotransferase family 2 domain-containing protein [Leptolyngbya sp. O-77]BAU43326.1 Sulfotransferase family protein [Leptolyngbya sp. O-77]
MDDSTLSTLYCPLAATDQLCYIHIPKTAGSTLTAIADAQFDVRQIAPGPYQLPALDPAAKNCTPEELRGLLTRYRFIRGHFSHNLIRQFLTRPVYITVLRDPVDRVISLYEFFRRAAQRGTAETPEYGVLMRAAAEHDLLGFVLHPDPIVQQRTSNFQTRQLAIWDGDEAALSVGDPQGDSLANCLQLACASVDRFAWVGVMEQFHASVQLLNYRFGWYPAAEYQNLRVVTHRPRREGLSPAVIEAIAQHNALDQALYDHAKTRFAAQYQQMLKALHQHENLQDASDPTAVQAALQQHYARHYAATHPPETFSGLSRKRFVYDFRQPLSGKGWHRRSGRFNGISPQDATRWSGPGPVSVLDLPLAGPLTGNADVRLTLEIDRAIAPDVLDSLELTVNQHPVSLRVQSRQGNGGVLTGTIPAIREAFAQAVQRTFPPGSALQHSQPFARFTFRVPHTLPLNANNPASEDDRLVGFALRQLTLEPLRRWRIW